MVVCTAVLTLVCWCGPAGGDVGFEELLALGQARRRLGHKSGVWTHEQNLSLMNNMGAVEDPASGQLTVSETNFVSYFSDILPIGSSNSNPNPNM